MTIRVVLQGIDQASLLVDNEARYVRVGRGVMIYIAFLKPEDGSEITQEHLEQAVDTILKTRIFTHMCPEKMLTTAQALEDHPKIDILIVPQASLGGKVKKGHTIQFHSLVDKATGNDLYERFCHLMRVSRGVDETTVDVNGASLTDTETEVAPKWIKHNGRVVSGTFGNRQGLVVESDGPFTHSFDLLQNGGMPATSSSTLTVWTSQQQCYRALLKSLRSAYFHDRAKLFWARHRVQVEFYKYSSITDAEEIKLLVGIGSEIAAFVAAYMKTDVERIVRHNETMMTLSASQAKKFRQEFLLSEKQHESWCKQKIKGMLKRRPPPPYPFF